MKYLSVSKKATVLLLVLSFFISVSTTFSFRTDIDRAYVADECFKGFDPTKINHIGTYTDDYSKGGFPLQFAEHGGCESEGNNLGKPLDIKPALFTLNTLIVFGFVYVMYGLLRRKTADGTQNHKV